MTEMKREMLSLQAEPNWALLGAEGGLPNPEWDQWVSCYCSLESQSTVVVTAGTDVWGCQGECEMSWVGYEWDSEGRAWQLSYGSPEDVSCRWWEVDDLVWGYGMDSPFAACVDGVVMQPREMVRRFAESGLLMWQPAAADAVELWWGPMTPRMEVELGLTQAEVSDAEDVLRETLRGFLSDEDD